MLQYYVALDGPEENRGNRGVLNIKSSVLSVTGFPLIGFDWSVLHQGLHLAFEHVVDELAVHRVLDKFLFGDVTVAIFVHRVSAQKIKHQNSKKYEESLLEDLTSETQAVRRSSSSSIPASLVIGIMVGGYFCTIMSGQ